MVAARVLEARAERCASSSLALSTSTILDLGFRIADLKNPKSAILNPKLLHNDARLSSFGER